MRIPVVSIALIAVLAAGCGGASNDGYAKPSLVMGTATASAGPDGVQHVTVEGTDALQFEPMTLKAHVGTLIVTLVDHGMHPHDIEFPTLHATSKTVNDGTGSQSTSLTLHLKHPGSYPFICTYHVQEGMRGVLTVVGK